MEHSSSLDVEIAIFSHARSFQYINCDYICIRCAQDQEGMMQSRGYPKIFQAIDQSALLHVLNATTWSPTVSHLSSCKLSQTYLQIYKYLRQDIIALFGYPKSSLSPIQSKDISLRYGEILWLSSIIQSHAYRSTERRYLILWLLKILWLHAWRLFG